MTAGPAPADAAPADIVGRLLDQPALATVTRSAAGWASVVASPVVPSAARPGTVLRVVDPHGTSRPVAGLDAPVGDPVWAEATDRPPLLAGYALRHGGVRPWVLDTGADTVTWPALPGEPAGASGTAPPIAWLGTDRLVVATPCRADDPPPVPGGVDTPLTFEAAPFSRVRVLPSARPAAPLCHALYVVDVASGASRAVSGPSRPYRALRGCPCGRHLAALVADRPEPIVYTLDEPAGWRSIPTPARHVDWLRSPDGERLVVVHADDEPGRTVVSTHADGTPTWTGTLPGGPLDVRRERDALWLLTGHPDTGAGHLSLLRPGAEPVVRTWTLGDHGPLHEPVLDDVDHTDGHLRSALSGPTRNGGRRVELLVTADDGETLVTRHRRALPPGAAPIRVTDWRRGILLMAGPGDRPVRRVEGGGRATLRRTARRPLQLDLGDPTGEGHTRVTLRLPADNVRPAATVVSIVPGRRGPRPHAPAGPMPTAEHLPWLTRLGLAVATVDVRLPWWPEVPDEELRPRATGAIAAAVTDRRLADHVDLDRLVLHGQSFAATLALLTLADTDLFAAGIVASGAYCRTLTPLGFQYERRTLWEAEQVYRDFDAVLAAPSVTRPVLILHGQQDQNPATPPEQAILLFQALTALGTASRLVLLPGEGHRVRSREGLAAVLTEQVSWVQRWTGDPAPVTRPQPAGCPVG
ncbi:prolyl oligopeptidase family serine peptidase [Plantactinospora sonchi]|uniref:Prolyl oligopeptidase family serine peptidase n=1 Tax=Plantactinospora sonchi TaxID=1544735 RepID=A0ABU7S0G5_9ACTN